MTLKRVQPGPEVVKEFVENLTNDKSLDKDTVEVIELLYAEDKLTQTKLQQALESKRKESQKHG